MPLAFWQFNWYVVISIIMKRTKNIHGTLKYSSWYLITLLLLNFALQMQRWPIIINWCLHCPYKGIPESKVRGANMRPTWVLSALDGPHVSPMNPAIWDIYSYKYRRANALTARYVWCYSLLYHGPSSPLLGWIFYILPCLVTHITRTKVNWIIMRYILRSIPVLCLPLLCNLMCRLHGIYQTLPLFLSTSWSLRCRNLTKICYILRFLLTRLNPF